MEVVILAGGFGTRLAGLVRDAPKPMAPVAGRPFLEYILDDLIRQGATRAVLAVGYKKEVIIEHFRQNYRGLEIRYSQEHAPLLTGGAIRQALSLCREERVFVINGDTFFQVNLPALRDFSEKKDGGTAIALKQMEDFSRYGAIEMDMAGSITAMYEKRYFRQGYINGGIYDMPRRVLEDYPKKFSLENDGFPRMLTEKQLFGFPSGGFFIDIGVPEDYRKAQELFASHA